MANNILKFPKGFLWGTATAGHQVEGNNKNSDWWAWEKSDKKIENSGIACDHYHLYKKDFRLANEILNNNSHRFSIEWARIEPKEGKFSKKEINHYKKVLKELKKLGFKSVVTFNHFVNPLWFFEKGGWENKKNIHYFERFIWKCSKEFEGLIDYWITFNEPNIYAPTAYLQGVWPPQKKSLIRMLLVFSNMAKAHKKAYKIIHKANPKSSVGSAIHMIAQKYFSWIDWPMHKLSKFLMNHSFLYLTRGYNDFIGINYYGLHINKFSDFLYKKFNKEEYDKFIHGEKNDLGWPIYPPGIYETVMDSWKKYELPIFITENGTADAHEPNRIRYIVNHLTWLHQAIKEGVDVRGYFYWSLMDNFEWHLGRDVRFGLFEVDYRTQKRTPRKSAFVYGKIAKDNAIDFEKLEKLAGKSFNSG